MARILRGSLPVLALLGVLMLSTSRCDIPTEAPNFGFTTRVEAPLLLDQTFVLLGPDANGLEPLIDTTAASFDTLLSVDGTNRIYVNQELDDFDIGDVSDLLGDVSVDPINVSVTMGDLEQQTFNTSPLGDPVGVMRRPGGPLAANPGDPPLEFPLTPDSLDNTRLIAPIPNVLVPPVVNLLDFGEAEVVQVRLTAEADTVNIFNFTLLNDLGVALTDGSGGGPILILEQQIDGTMQTIAQQAFSGPVGANASASVSIPVSGATLTGDVRYRFVIDAGGAGIAPIVGTPNSVRLTMDLDPLRYEETIVDEIVAQNAIDASIDEMTLQSETEFQGIITQSGAITLTLTNTLPVPVELMTVEVTILDEVPPHPAGSVLLNLDDLVSGTPTIPASNGSVDLIFQFNERPIAPRLSVRITARSDGSGGQNAAVHSDDGIFTAVNGDVMVASLTFTPQAETFGSNGLLNIELEDVRFEQSEHYVEFQEGSMWIDEIRNEMDLDLEILQISLPEFRESPYTPADSLLITFSGTSEDPENNRFRQLSGGSIRTDLEVDLAGVRLYPKQNEAFYNVNAVSVDGGTSSLLTSDEIRADISTENLQILQVRGNVNPFTFEFTDDVNGDTRLDLANDQEAEIMDLDGLDALSEQGLEGLAFNGSNFTFTINTNVGADVVFYAAMMGTTPDGETMFLSGRGDYAVSASDTLAASFTYNGAPIDPSNLIQFTIPGTPSADQTVTRMILLTNQNSTIDAFVSALPEEFRYVGKGLIIGLNGTERVQFRKPFNLDAGIGASIPLSITGEFTFTEEYEADLSDLSDVSDPDEDVSISEGGIILEFTNGLPIAIDTRIEFLDGAGEIIAALPAPEVDPLLLEAAPANADGLATGTAEGVVELSLLGEHLDLLSETRRIRVQLAFGANPNTPATFLATDTIRLSLRAHMNVNVRTEN